MPPPDDARRVAPRVDVIERLADVPAHEWNALTGSRYPFLRHEFLVAAEASGCVSPAAGWSPRHLVLRDQSGKLRAAMPLYEKTHSWGEFVFDWAWANAYERAGLPYYPKLVSAAPFTPAPSPRLLRANPQDDEAGAALARAAIALARDDGLSSLHVQFPLPSERSLLTAAGLRLRKDCQFHWHNRNYRDFDDFLAQLNARKRKKAKRDRRRVAEQGITFRHLTGHDIDTALWRDVHELVSTTFLLRGSMPYLDEPFFVELGRTLPDSLLVVLAERGPRMIAAAIFYRGINSLYGRYWGSDGHYDALHFETCYYQGIDFCVEHGIARFEPGTQGEHKISRGFVPVTTWSAHWLARAEFFAAIGDYLRVESEHVDAYIEAVEQHSPYRRNESGGDPAT